MTKTKNLILGLGMTATLGLAALPVASYATVTTTPAVNPTECVGTQTSDTCALDVTVQVNVADVIAMTIEGNGDGGAPGVVAGSEDDMLEPTYSDDPGPSSSTLSILPNSAKETMTSTITVYTNVSAGYSLAVRDEDTNNNLVATNGTIAPIASGASLTAGTAGGQWGIKGGDITSYTAVPTSSANALTILSNGSKNSSGQATTITYGVSTASDQATGTYTDTIVYTATSK